MYFWGFLSFSLSGESLSAWQGDQSPPPGDPLLSYLPVEFRLDKLVYLWQSPFRCSKILCSKWWVWFDANTQRETPISNGFHKMDNGIQIITPDKLHLWVMISPNTPSLVLRPLFASYLKLNPMILLLTDKSCLYLPGSPQQVWHLVILF